MLLQNNIPTTIRKPGHYAELDTSGKPGLPDGADTILLLGHKTSSGSAAADTAEQILSAAKARELFGTGSPVALMAAALLSANPYAELYGMGVDEDGAAAAATGTITFVVTTVVAGTLTVACGRFLMNVGVEAGATETEIAAAVAAKINADKTLPFTATSAAGVVTYTAQCKGTAGNNWVWAGEFTGSGLTATIVQPAGGATDGDIATALDNAAPTKWDIIATEFNDATNLGAILSHLDTVSGAVEQRPGIVVAGSTDSLATATTLGSSLNSGRGWLGELPGTRGHPMEIAAQLAGVLSAESDKAKPLNNVVLPDIPVPDSSSDLLTRAEQESCLKNGVTPLHVVAGKVCIVRSVSTYVQDADGNDDDALLDIQTIRVLDYFRESVTYTLGKRFNGKKLASKAIGPNTVDPTMIRAELIGVALAFEQLGLLQNIEDSAADFVVEIDDSVAGRVNYSIPAPVVPGFHQSAGVLHLII